MPCVNACQHIVDEHILLQPSAHLLHDIDTFGNRIQYGHTTVPHRKFAFTSIGEVELSPYCIHDPTPSPMYRMASPLTRPSPTMLELAHACAQRHSNDNLGMAVSLSDIVHSHMQYSPGTTNSDTPAAEAFMLGRGVCQDYAHILISMCRSLGITARYASGFLPGTGYTHAWAEVYADGQWTGIDPTNGAVAEYGYIKIAHGRDAADCPVNRGVFIGASGQCSEVTVSVEEIKMPIANPQYS